MSAESRCRLCSGLIILAALLLSSGGVYVRRGSDITDCSMKCPHTDGVLELYRECDGKEARLLELWCDNMWFYNHYQPRLLYDTSTGCWTLTDAGKSDSCVYKVVYYGKVGRSLTTLHITVQDPVTITTITSNGSRTGQDIAVSVQFSGEETAVTWEVDGGLLPERYRLMDDNRTVIIPRAQRDDAGRKLRVRITNPVSDDTREYQLEITDPAASRGHVCIQTSIVVMTIIIALLVMYCRPKRTKTEDVEKCTEVNGERISSSQTDRPGEKNLLIRIRETWENIRKTPEYEETPQRRARDEGRPLGECDSITAPAHDSLYRTSSTSGSLAHMIFCTAGNMSNYCSSGGMKTSLSCPTLICESVENIGLRSDNIDWPDDFHGLNVEGGEASFIF